MGRVKKKTEQAIGKVNRYLTKDLWSAEFLTMGKWRRRLHIHQQAIIICTRDFFRNRIGREAVALSFFSTMAAVPLLALILFITSGVGLEQMLEAKLYSTFPDSGELIEFILGIAQNMVGATENGAFGWISFLTFIWLVLWLMIQIGVAFNRVWHIKGMGQRKIITKLVVYLGFMISVPFVILLFLSGWAYYIRFFVSLSSKLGAFSFITENIFWLIYYVVASFALSMMYKLIPAKKVHYAAALKAAFIVGIVYVAVQYLYMGTQILVTRISGVYGVLAFVPLFMVWMNLSWQTVLYGATLSSAFHEIQEWKDVEYKLADYEKIESVIEKNNQNDSNEQQ